MGYKKLLKSFLLKSTEKNYKRILVVNRCATDNFGDRIIGHTMLQLFSNEKVHCHLFDYTFLTRDCPHGRVLHRLFTIVGIIKAILLIIKTDAVVFGGGELLSNNLKFYKCLKIWARLIEIFNHNVYRCVFSCGATDSFGDDRKIKDILERFNYIYVRDPYSKELINRICPAYSNIAVIPDCVFAYYVPKEENEYSNTALIGVTDASRYSRHGMISLNEENLLQYYEEIIDGYHSSYDQVLLIYNTKNDEAAAKYVYDKLHDKYSKLKVATIKDEFEFVRVIGKAAIVASPRMHSSIVAMIQKVPCDPILISNKMKVFYDLYFPFDSNRVLELKERVVNAAESVLHCIIGEI